MTQPNTILRITTTSMSSGGMSLNIEDVASGTVLADLQLTGDQAWRMIQGTTLNLRGRISPDLTRVGLYRHNESIDIPVPPYRDDSAKLADEWMATNKPSHWDHYRVDHTNHGYVAVGYWWNEDPGKTQRWTYIDGEDMPV